MLPAQFVDCGHAACRRAKSVADPAATGGQVKDSFGGMILMFRGLAGAITLPMVGATSLAVATGALAYAPGIRATSTRPISTKRWSFPAIRRVWTADRMLVLSRAGQAAGLTFNQTSESLSALVKAGVSGELRLRPSARECGAFLLCIRRGGVDKVAEAFSEATRLSRRRG